MNNCPITYEPCGEEKYSERGLKKLSPKLNTLHDLPYSAKEQRQEAIRRAAKMSIQGVQSKISVIGSIKEQIFKIVDKGGTYIIKPQSDLFEQLPENEDVTMKMALEFGINVPLTGLVYSKDRSMSYFIKRFDRYGKNKKYALEDFAQLTGNNRNTKYTWSMEKLVPVIEQHCTFPLIEKLKLFRSVLFCFITGNEDMHLKNFSLLVKDGKIELSPAYDLLNTTIAMKNTKEEMALPLSGKKNKIDANILFNYYGVQKLGLNKNSLESEWLNLFDKRNALDTWIQKSFLTPELKISYLELMEERFDRLIKSNLTFLT